MSQMNPVHDITFYTCKINVIFIILAIPTFYKWPIPSRFSALFCAINSKYLIHTECRNVLPQMGRICDSLSVTSIVACPFIVAIVLHLYFTRVWHRIARSGHHATCFYTTVGTVL